VIRLGRHDRAAPHGGLIPDQQLAEASRSTRSV
jgi:hypothetical protein